MVTLVDLDAYEINPPKIQSKVFPENQPSFEEWCKEFNVGITYNKFNSKAKEYKKASFLNNLIETKC